jgi:hypothetical protein
MRPGSLLPRLFIPFAVVVVTAAPAAAQSTSSPAPGMGTVVVVHALEGVSADVYLDGSNSPALQSFDFRRITDPLAVPAGQHRADIRKAGDPPTAPPAMSGEFTVTADQRITVAALLKPDGTPSWLAFPNDTWTTDPTSAAFRFRHLAAAAPVQLVLDGRTLPDPYTNLAVGNQSTPVTTTPGTHTLAVIDAATGASVVPAQSLDLPAGTLANVYLTGKASPKTLALLAQTPTGTSAAAEVSGLQTTPQIIATGDSGLADPTFTRSTFTSVPFVFGAAVAVACGVLGALAMRRGARVRPR